jgi:hypothetical protein
VEVVRWGSVLAATRGMGAGMSLAFAAVAAGIAWAVGLTT